MRKQLKCMRQTCKASLGRAALFVLTWLGLSGTAWTQTGAAMMPRNPYQSLDDKARAVTDTASARSLTDEIIGLLLFGPITPSLSERIVRAQLAFIAGHHPVITE